MAFAPESTARAVDYVVTAANWNLSMYDIDWLAGTRGPVVVSTSGDSYTFTGSLIASSSASVAGGITVKPSADHARIYLAPDTTSTWAILGTEAGALELYEARNSGLITTWSSSGNMTHYASILAGSSMSVAGELTVTKAVHASSYLGCQWIVASSGIESEGWLSLTGLGTTRPETLGTAWLSSTYVLISTGASP